MTVAAMGALTSESAGRFYSTVRKAMETAAGWELTIDLSRVTTLDSAGVVAVLECLRAARDNGGVARLIGAGEPHDRMLNLVDAKALAASGVRRRSPPSGLLYRIGVSAVALWTDINELLGFIGRFTIELLRTVRHPSRLRWSEMAFYMERAGVEASPICCLIGLLLGLILGFQAAIQLRQFGANIYVADLVGVSLTREIGPLLAAIIVAGRSGSSFAAEIGTMKVSEEVAALEIMGFDPMRFLVMPKVIALVIMLPLLTMLTNVVGMFGGLVVGVLQLDLSASHYIQETRIALVLSDIVTGIFKSCAFALLVAGIGCFRGLQVTSDAESVGAMTTSAVVSGIFLVILSDALFTVTFFALGV